MSLYAVALLVSAGLWGGVLSWHDCRERRLPNWLTVGGAAAALVFRFGFGGAPCLLDGFAAAAVAGAFMLVPFLLRGAGGGDVKMLFAAGAVVGWRAVVPMLWYTSLAGLLFGLVLLASRGICSRRTRHWVRCLFDPGYDRRAGAAALPERARGGVKIPYSIPITAGMLASLAL